jgi:hypothetical protein
MSYLIDTHIHPRQYIEGIRGYEGISPNQIARTIVNDTKLDAFALTQHYAPSGHFSFIEEEIACLTHGTRRHITSFLGTEVNMKVDKKFHVCVVFQDHYNSQNRPAAFPMGGGLKDLEQYKKDYNSVAILCHPYLKDKMKRENLDPMLQSGLIDGVEILNGSVIHICRDTHKLVRTLELADEIKHEFAFMGTSDAHQEEMIGSCATKYEGDSPLDFFKAVKEKTTVPAVTGYVKDVVEKVRNEIRAVRGLNGLIWMPK